MSDIQPSPAPRTLLSRLTAVLPRPATRRYASFARDVAMLRDTLAGRAPRPFSPRHAPPAEPSLPGPALAPRVVRVRSVTRETADAVSLTFEDPTGAPMSFRPGQFFTLLVRVEGEALRRAYSASSSALEPATATVTIKRVAGGKVSNHLVETMHEGASLEILGPSGSFGPAPATGPRRLVLLAGGSGITPMMSIARTLLAGEPDTALVLLYGNRAPRDIVFADALSGLAAAHPGRLVLRHVLSEPPPGWTGGTGLLDAATTARELAPLLPADGLTTDFFVCGPEPMMAAARTALAELGVPPAHIHEERFSSPHLRTGTGEVHEAHDVTVRGRGGEIVARVEPEKTLLEAGLEAGAPMPFSCAMGGCGACKVKVVSGELEMEEPNCLSPAERAEGCVLACVARPKRPSVVELP